MRKDFGRNNDQQGKILAEITTNEETFRQKNRSTRKEFDRKTDQQGFSTILLWTSSLISFLLNFILVDKFFY